MRRERQGLLESASRAGGEAAVPCYPDEDVELEAELAAAQGMEPGRIDDMLFDQRDHKPRRNRYKLLVESVRETAV